LVANGQGYKLFSFTDEQGLTSNLVKTIVQDADGYILSGTDDGLVIYDSHRFNSLNISLPSIYIKSLYKTSKNEVIAVTDYGIGYLKKNGINYEYQSLLKSYPVNTDTAFFYPKGVYEDRQGTLWFCDQSSVGRIVNGRLRKYTFDSKYTSDSYFRAFLFAEDGQDLIVSSWRGYLFRYDKKSDSFVKLPYEPSNDDLFINQIVYTGKHTYMLATRSGLLEVAFSADYRSNTSHQFLKLPLISCFKKDTDGRYIIGTWATGAYIYDPEKNTCKPIVGIDSKTINNIFTDRENTFWFATDDGISVLKKTAFATPEQNPAIKLSGSSYIRNLVTDENRTVYFSDQESIYRVIKSQHGFTYESIHNSNGKRVYSFDIKEGNLWASYRNGELYTKGEKTKLFSLQETGGRITDLVIDRDGNCWGFVEQQNRVIRIDKAFHIKIFPFPQESNNSQLLKCDKSGELSFLYANHTIHFFHFNPKKQIFEEIPYQPAQQSSSPIVLFDLFTAGDRTNYLVTSTGLLTLRNGVMSQESSAQDKLSNAYKAVYIDNQNYLWLGTEKGLQLEFNGQRISFNKKDGLPNSVIVPRGIVADKDNRIWIATASGIAYWQMQKQGLSKTIKPILLSLLVNKHELSHFQQDEDFPGYCNMSFSFTSITYPNRIVYQTRLLGIDDSWSEPGTETKSEYLNLPPGDYVFQVRAQQEGALWSDVSEYHFTITRPWYLTFWMFAVYIISVFLIIGFFISFIQQKKVERIEAENRKLESLIHEKTKALLDEKEEREKLLAETQAAKKELERANKDLIKTNALKNDLLSITAHDLKNPLSNIMAYSQVIQEDELTREELRQFMAVIHQSSLNMLKIISELLDSVVLESTNFVLDLEPLDLDKMLQKIIYLNEPQTKMKEQHIVFDSCGDCVIPADPKWVKEAIDNLVSNAIKYSPRGAEINVKLEKGDKTARISVADAGPGFTEADKQQMYGKFKRLSAKPTGGESSTGLGLSIVKEVISLHGWEISLDSEPGHGSTFTITVPMASK
jgi:signal transduction histidine kinase/ligand-binding sensor domain-containing protein